MSHTVVALYPTRELADRARDALNRAGVDSGHIRLIDRNAGRLGDNSTLAGGDHQDFFDTLTRMFMPSADAGILTERLGQGGVLLCAEVEEEQLARAADLLEHSGCIHPEAGEEGRSSPVRIHPPTFRG